MGFAYNGTLLSYTAEQIINIYNNMGESQSNYSRRKKPDKECTLRDSMHVNSRKYTLIYRDRKQTNFAWAQSRDKEDWITKEHEEAFEDDQSVHHLDSGLGSQGHPYEKAN